MRRSICATFVVAFACLFASPNAQAVHVTGVSDQHLFEWSGESRAFFRGFTKIRQARYNTVPWDVASHPGSKEYADVTSWLDSANALGLRPLVSFSYGLGTRVPDAASFRTAFASFRRTWPGVREFTAWNEPNHPAFLADPSPQPTRRTSSYNVARYWWQLNAECGSSCTVAAGDFDDFDVNLASFVDSYKSNLADVGAPAPAVWAVHGYNIANNSNGIPFNDFLNRTSGDVWVTEIGAYECVKNGATLGTQTQRLAAININRIGDITRSRVSRIYYYGFAEREYGDPLCPTHHEDTLLIDQGRIQRPAARVIRDGVPLPLVYLNGQWYMRYSFTTGSADTQFSWPVPGGPQPGDEPLSGDWDGDGIATPGIHRGNLFYLYSSNDPWGSVSGFILGEAGDHAIVGDWNNDGIDTIALQRANLFYVSNVNSTGGTSPDDYALQFGEAGDVGVGGDWNGDDVDTIGVVRGNVWYLLNGRTNTSPSEAFIFGDGGDLPVTGDWDGDGRDDPGVFRNGAWYLSNAHASSGPGVAFDFGNSPMRPVVGG